MSVERETFPGLLAAGARVCGHVDRGYWRDLGTPADFVAGSADLVRGLAPTGALPGPVGDALVLGGAVVAYRASVVGGSTIGADCAVGAARWWTARSSSTARGSNPARWCAAA